MNKRRKNFMMRLAISVLMIGMLASALGCANGGKSPQETNAATTADANSLAMQDAQNAYNAYVSDHTAEGTYYLYAAKEDRVVVLKDGQAVGVYESMSLAQKAAVGESLYDIIPTDSEKLYLMRATVWLKQEITAEDIEQGGYANGPKVTATNRLRVNELIFVKAGSTVTYQSNGMNLYFRLVAAPKSASALQQSGWKTGEGEYTLNSDGYLAVIAAKENLNDRIEPQDYTAKITVNAKNTAVENTKSRLIYQFGGAGNDWCFVYLPPNYDPNRAEPYPFVITNHGNGWNMDGSAQFANWTKRTMYVSPDDSDYKNAPTQYNATKDQSLWYSNPTIEALLKAGYIVCGAQNYGDSLYGNAACRDACVAFYNHMVKTYNVTEKCHMIGASNGAMTTLNAVYVLGEKVDSIILQYPLTCLTNQYFSNSSHQSAICGAHRVNEQQIRAGIFMKEKKEFDPLYANVENGKKVGYFPRTKIYYSSTDTVTKADANALPLYQLLDESGLTVEIVQVDADGKNRAHGDYAHFVPKDYVNWFNG